MNNRTNIVTENPKTSKILSFYWFIFLLIIYKSVTKNPKTLSESEKMSAQGKGNFIAFYKMFCKWSKSLIFQIVYKYVYLYVCICVYAYK